MLKKIILAAAVAVSAVFAQSSVNVGGHAAIGMGSIWGENTENANWGFGFNAGVVAKMDLNSTVAFVPGVQVDYRGISNDQGSVTQTLAFTYIELPLLLRINATPSFAIDVGPSLAFNVGASIKYSDNENSVSVDIPSKYVNSFEFGLIAGVSIAVTPKFDINVRAALGLTDMMDMKKMIVDEDDYGYVPEFGFKNMRFKVGATYWFM